MSPLVIGLIVVGAVVMIGTFVYPMLKGTSLDGSIVKMAAIAKKIQTRVRTKLMLSLVGRQGLVDVMMFMQIPIELFPAGPKVDAAMKGRADIIELFRDSPPEATTDDTTKPVTPVVS